MAQEYKRGPENVQNRTQPAKAFQIIIHALTEQEDEGFDPTPDRHSLVATANTAHLSRPSSGRASKSHLAATASTLPLTPPPYRSLHTCAAIRARLVQARSTGHPAAASRPATAARSAARGKPASQVATRSGGKGA
jgi:hypothetical protein